MREKRSSKNGKANDKQLNNMPEALVIYCQCFCHKEDKKVSFKGVIYARYSSDNQREESIEGQIRDCMAYAEKEGITLLSPYIDRALSAKTDNRPAFQKMIKDSAKGLFDVVIVWKLDRFARNRYDSAHYKTLLRKNGVQVFSATENISQKSDGILMEAVLEGMAEYYSAELSEKVRRGHRENAIKNQFNGGTYTMGLIIDGEQRYQIDPIVGPLILEAFTMYDQGLLVNDIIKHMNKMGVKSSRGGKISVNIACRMLRNRKYAGDYVYGDTVNEDTIPAIVPRDLFNRVQERLDKNIKASARFKAPEHYLLTTKLRCGECGSTMVGESGTSHTCRIYNYYKCSNYKKKKGCKKKSVQKSWIEQLVIENTKSIILEDDVVNYIADITMELQSQENDRIPFYKQQIAETERAIENVLNAIQQGIFNASTKKRLDDLEDRKSQLEVNIIEDELAHPQLTREQILFWIMKFRELDTKDETQCQRLIDSFVNMVYVYEDRIVLTLNYRDGTKEITINEVKGSDIVASGAPWATLSALFDTCFDPHAC